MATCRDIITGALRRARVYGPGETPNADDAADGMIALQSMFDGWRTGGTFGRLVDVMPDVSGPADEQQRVLLSGAITATLPTEVKDKDSGLMRPPLDLALIEIITPADAVPCVGSLYDAGRGDWVQITALTLDGEAPLSARDEFGLSCCLAEVMAPEYNGSLMPSTMLRAGAFRRMLVSRFGSQRRTGQAVYY
jgi:hypothetical protein